MVLGAIIKTIMKLYKLIIFLIFPLFGEAQVAPISFLGKPVQTNTAEGSIVTNGLLVHLDAGNTASYPGTGTIWIDLSGNNRNATLFNGVGYSTANRGSLTFDGVDDYVSSMNLSSYPNFTLEIWLYDIRNNINSDRDILTYNGNAGSYTYNGSSFRTDGNGDGGRSFNSTGQPPANTWYRFCLVKDGDLYINQTKYTGTGADNAYGVLNFGATRSDVNSRLNGRIAIVRIYNRTLAAEEIQQNFNATKARFGL
ncbi:hypothetical protein GJJ64_15250 [Pedobacter sp. HX-22-1]|uniref:LamG domain-containing protein n=2 Tax=Pedobacter puniceum TaxID=2666136 RepID=A0A7K0FRC0_9SPHI|nr:hypothetical protein [Pedobacter puniceum]